MLALQTTYVLHSAMDLQKLSQSLQNQLMPKPSSGNQRAYADMIEETACALAAVDSFGSFKPARSVRSPEDFTLLDGDQTHYIDVKTRQLGTEFNMPNLISVDRLDQLLSQPNTELHYWMIDYCVLDSGECRIQHSEIRTVWSMPWAALSIQNLGKGQLQISKWAELSTYTSDRAAWHQQLKLERKAFYLKQAQKFQKMAEKIRV